MTHVVEKREIARSIEEILLTEYSDLRSANPDDLMEILCDLVSPISDSYDDSGNQDSVNSVQYDLTGVDVNAVTSILNLTSATVLLAVVIFEKFYKGKEVNSEEVEEEINSKLSEALALLLDGYPEEEKERHLRAMRQIVSRAIKR